MNSAGYPTYLVNGAVSVNSGVADENGSFWYLDGEIAGWDSPDMRQTMLTRIGNTPSADGEIAADNHYRGRSLVFTLIAECASEAAREASRLLLAGALDLISTTGTFLAEEVIPKQVSIIRSGNSNQGKLVMTDCGFAMKNATEALSRTVTDAVTTGSSENLVSASANFGTGDIGQPVTGTNIPPGTVVVSITSTIEVVMSNEATASGSDQTVTIGGYPGFPVGTVVWLLKAEIEIYAQDPRKYSPVPNEAPFESNVAMVTNEGNTATQNAVITIEVTGGGDGPFHIEIVSVADMELLVPPLPAGAPALDPIPTELVVDLYNKTITDGEERSYYYLRNLQTPWLTIPPGVWAVSISGAGGSNIPGSVVSYSAWI